MFVMVTKFQKQTDSRADGTVSNKVLYGNLTFLDSNGNSKNVSEDTVPVVK